MPSPVSAKTISPTFITFLYHQISPGDLICLVKLGCPLSNVQLSQVGLVGLGELVVVVVVGVVSHVFPPPGRPWLPELLTGSDL